MKLSITFAFLLILFSTPILAADEFKVSDLSERGQKAYEILLHANRFEDLGVSYFGLHSLFVMAYGILVEEEKADAAFKSLVKNASKEGAMYALAATFFTDQKYFYKTAELLKKSKLNLRQGRGCLIMSISISEAIESKQPNVAIIGSGESFEQYIAGKRGQRVILDLINGGFPAALKHFAEKQNERRKGLWKRNTSRSALEER